jgi:hypothetical protein
MSCRTVNVAERSSRTVTAWENVLRVGEDSHRRMRAMLDDLMDRIFGWVKLQDEMNASFENAAGVIRGLGEDKAKLRTERDLPRVKTTGRTKQHEETTTLLKRMGVIVKKLMDNNAMLRI